MQDRIYNYFERNTQLRELVVFDRMGVIEEDLRNVSWPEDYVYRVYNGKWLNLKVSIAREWRGNKVVLVPPTEMRHVTEMKRWYLFYSTKLDQLGQVLENPYGQADIKLEQAVQVKGK